MTVWEVAKFFEEYFFKSTDAVNILRPNVVSRATEHIGEQIKLIQKLEENGLIYVTDQAIYFDVSKFPNYGALTGQKLEEKRTAVRGDVVSDSNKKNPQDFALWFFTVGHFSDHTMRWPSPWGEGFPGWHIECSAMAMEYLGDTLDIHTGGIDHIPVHHTNEIAQSEGATGKKFVNFWVHHNFLIVDGEKMSKSKKNFFKIEEIKAKEFDPLALRYLILTANYRDKLNFTWQSLEGAQITLNKIREEIRGWDEPIGSLEQAEEMVGPFWQKFLEAANKDLNTPQAVVVLHQLLKANGTTSRKARLLLEMDKVLGLGLDYYLAQKIEVPQEIQKLLDKRQIARDEKDFTESDKLRDEIKKLGYEVKDTPDGQSLKKIN